MNGPAHKTKFVNRGERTTAGVADETQCEENIPFHFQPDVNGQFLFLCFIPLIPIINFINSFLFSSLYSVCLGSNAETSDGESQQIQTFASNQSEVTESDGKKHLNGSVRHSRHPRRVQRKHNTSGKKQQGLWCVFSAWKRLQWHI